jgi:hypothetical protein
MDWSESGLADAHDLRLWSGRVAVSRLPITNINYPPRVSLAIETFCSLKFGKFPFVQSEQALPMRLAGTFAAWSIRYGYQEKNYKDKILDKCEQRCFFYIVRGLVPNKR